jgi:hypothetical protein
MAIVTEAATPYWSLKYLIISPTDFSQSAKTAQFTLKAFRELAMH